VFIKNQLLKKGGKVLFFVCFAVVLKLLIIFFVSCYMVQIIWCWITNYNSFIFQSLYLDDI
jgi:hypothetical protein